MARVRGHVFYKDGSVPKGSVAVVRFSPTPDSTAEIRKGASGAIEADGSFEMMTKIPGDGVYLGDYAVTFVVQRDGMNSSTSVISPKYTSAMSPPFKITVDGNKDDLRYEIEPLSAGGSAPGNATAAPAGKPASG